MKADYDKTIKYAVRAAGFNRNRMPAGMSSVLHTGFLKKYSENGCKVAGPCAGSSFPLPGKSPGWQNGFVNAVTVILFLVFNVFSIHAQDTLQLDYFLKAAVENSPAARRLPIADENSSLKSRNISNTLLPSVSFNAQANYNSETIDLGGALQGSPVSFPELPLDQYKIWADINQVIFGGGAVIAQKAMEKASLTTETGQADADLYMLKQNVVQVYFAILLADKNTEVLRVTRNELNEKAAALQAGVDNGAVMSDVLLSVKAEGLKLDQLISEALHSRQKLLNSLSVLTGTGIETGAVFGCPHEPVIMTGDVSRKELQLFDDRKEYLDISKKLITASDMPKLFAFSQLAYGRPGFNMISSDFHGFYSAGIGLKWNFIDYGQSIRQKKLLDLQKDLIDVQKDLFSNQLEIQLLSEMEDIDKYTSLIETDEEIVSLRETIASAGFSKLNNGVISPTDYLSQVDAGLLAKLQLENHKILKIQASYNYLFLQGKL